LLELGATAEIVGLWFMIEKDRNMMSRSQEHYPIVTVVGVLCLAMAADAANLAGSDLSGWRERTGEWQIAGDAFSNPENDKLLTSRPRDGAFSLSDLGSR